MQAHEMVLWGCLGGALPDILRLVAVRYRAPPKYLKVPFFWLSLLLLIGLGGLAAYLLQPERVVDAIALGFSAPEILSHALASKRSRASRRARTRDSLPDILEYGVPHAELPKRDVLDQLRRWWAN
jgi:hypothetical protein